MKHCIAPGHACHGHTLVDLFDPFIQSQLHGSFVKHSKASY